MSAPSNSSAKTRGVVEDPPQAGLERRGGRKKSFGGGKKPGNRPPLMVYFMAYFYERFAENYSYEIAP
jgi:hypothetical protein